MWTIPYNMEHLYGRVQNHGNTASFALLAISRFESKGRVHCISGSFYRRDMPTSSLAIHIAEDFFAIIGD